MKGHMGIKNKAPFGHTDGTHAKIEKHVRKHKATGGSASGDADRGDDQAEEDLGRKNMEYTKDSNVNRESEEKVAKRGGKMKRKAGGCVDGKMTHMHGGRKPRASGGGCESNPFTTANKGTMPKDHKTESMTMGRD